MKIDSTKPPREGEELPKEKLQAYLAPHLGPLENLVISQFPGGHSNLTYLLQDGEKEWVLRRPPFGSKVKTAHDMSREFRVLSGLAGHFDKVPRVYHHCEDEDVIGAPFYIMERLRGVILRGRTSHQRAITNEIGRAITTSFANMVVELHAVPLSLFDGFGKPDGYVERQVSGWTKRYQASATEEVPDMDDAAQWLAENQPESPAPTLIHNDLKLDNVVLDPENPSRILGVLDWEMATAGDPLMDLGTALCYWLNPDDDDAMNSLGILPAPLPGTLTRRELVDHYAEHSGRSPASMAFYYSFGLFKTAVIAQQIYYRYVHGHTTDPRFAALGKAAKLLAQKACEVGAGGTPL